MIFDQITPELITKCALKTKGAVVPSCFNRDDWRQIIGNNAYGTYGNDLCKVITETTKRFCIAELLNSHGLKSVETLMIFWLILFAKNPGVRPIGIGQSLGEIMGKVVMNIFKKDVMEVAGPSQLCTSWL